MNVLTLATVVLLAASTSEGATSAAALAGRWQSAPLELALTDDFHRSVYGSGAHSVRSVTMAIEPSGGGVFRVTDSVRDKQARVVAGTQETQEVTFTVGDLVEEAGRPAHFTTHVAKAERRFADDPSLTFNRDGVTLAIYVMPDKPGSVEVRFDTPEGTGSFWETLSKHAPRRR